MRASTNDRQLSALKTILQNGTVRQVAFLIGIAISVVVGIALYSSIAEPTYRPLDYQLTQRNMSSIVDVLEKARISYKINEQDGVVLVPAQDFESARIKLAAAGVPKDNGFNFSYMNDQNALTNSQFQENARYLLALEDDLGKTISGIEGISGARVHIAIPRNNLFADENNKVTASVLVNIAPGLSSNKEIIRSIIQIIASSVPGLDPKNVSITDQYGHLLSDGTDPNSLYSAAQLSYQNNVQSYYEKRIETMLVPILGESKVIVRVNADIDFTQQEDAQEDFDPTKTAVVSEQTDNEQNSSGGGASGAPGALSNSAPGGGAGASNQAGWQSKSLSTKNYHVSKSIIYKKSGAAKVKSLSVAVVVDNESVFDPQTHKMTSRPLAQDKINKITDLVKTTIGFDSARGDKVTVINSGYTASKKEIPDMKSHLWDQVWFWDVMKKIVGIILGFSFMFFIYKKLPSLLTVNIAPRPIQRKVAEHADGGDEDDDDIKPRRERKQGMNELKELAKNDPEKIASIIKTWVRK